MNVSGTVAAGETVTVRLADKAKATTVANNLADGNPGFRFRFVNCTAVAFVGWEYKFTVKAVSS